MDLASTRHVFVRYNAVKGTLKMPGDGLFPIISRLENPFPVNIHAGGQNSIDRSKHACILGEKQSDEQCGLYI